MIRRKYSFVTVAHEADYNAMRLQARSMALYCPDDLTDRIIIIENFTPGRRFSWRADLLRDYGPLAGLVEFVAASDFGTVPAAEGWWTQQLFKLLISARIKSERYLVLDAKNHLVSALDSSFLEDADGRARIYSEGYRDHPLEAYFHEVCRYLGIDDECYIDRFITTAPPFLMVTAQVQAMITDISRRENRPFADFFLQDKRMTEFFLYGGYLVSTGVLDSLYDLHSTLCPTIWAHTASREEVDAMIGQSDHDDRPFFGIHRTAYGSLDDRSCGLIADYWLRRGLFPGRDAALNYLYGERKTQRRLQRQRFLTSLPRRVGSRIKRMVVGVGR